MAEMSSRGTNLQQGEAFTLRASAAATAVTGATGTAVTMYGERKRFIILCDITNSDTDADDTLDVYVDVLISGTTWANAIHFTQQAGTGAAKKMFAVLDATAPAATVTDITTDAASGVVRPSLFGSEMRARWTVAVGAGGGAASHTFAVTGYAL